MIGRTLSVASAAMIGSLAISAHATIASAAENCRASPGTETPGGGHWRYRIEKGSGNKCWYLTGVEASASAAGEKTTTDSKLIAAAPNPKSTQMQPSVADARAELQKPESKLLATNVSPQFPTPASDSATPADTNASQQKESTVLAQRWPEPNSVRSSDEEFVEKMRVAADSTAQNATVAPSEQVSLPASQDNRDDSASSTLRILLVAIIGVFALAGILLRAATRYLAKRRKRIAPRRPIWDDLAIDAGEMPPYIPRSAPTQPAQYTGAKNPRYAYRDDEDARTEIEQLLRRTVQREQN